MFEFFRHLRPFLFEQTYTKIPLRYSIVGKKMSELVTVNAFSTIKLTFTELL